MEHSGQPTAPVAPGSQPQVVIHQQQPMAHGVQQVIVTGPVCPQCKVTLPALLAYNPKN